MLSQHHHRSIYNFLDWLGDVGGLFDGLKVVGGIIVSMYNIVLGDPLQIYLLKSILKVEKKHKSGRNSVQ